MPTGPERAAGLYLRLSQFKATDEATTETLERQEGAGRALIEAKGWRVFDLYPDIESAYDLRATRQEFERLLEDIDAGLLGAVVAWRLDRLARSQEDFSRLWRLCDRHGVTLVTVREQFDTSTAAGMFAIRMMIELAHMESANISQRVQAQRQQAASKGRPRPGGRGGRAYGYAPDGVTIIEDEARWVREGARRILDGERLRRVVADLTREGMRTVGGLEWRPDNFRQLLTSARVSGQRSYKGEVVADGSWPAILDRLDWEELRLLFRKGTPAARRYLLGRWILRCGVCGQGLSGRPAQGRPPRYGCWSEVGPRRGCGGIVIACHRLDELVSSAVLTALDSPEFTAALAAQAHSTIDTRALLDEIALDEAMLESLADDYAARIMTRAEWLRARESTLRRIEGARSTLGRSNRMLARLPSGADALRGWWADASDDQRRALIGMVLDQVVVHPVPRTGSRSEFHPERVELRWRV